MNYDVLLVNKALRDGHTIAKKLERATSSEEIDHLEKEINDYGDFVDAEFGVIDEDDPFQEKNCELSFLLCLVTEAKTRHIYYGSSCSPNSNYEIGEFEKYLDGKSWLPE